MGMFPRDAAHGTEMQDRTIRREYPRALFSVPLKLRHLTPGGPLAAHGISLDISEGGLGAIVEGNLRIGEAVEIDLALGKRKWSAVAVVKYASNTRCGFEFQGLNQDERRQILSFAGKA
jgi:c-di-GMP-binding flagellar brake protein YcgR